MAFQPARYCLEYPVLSYLLVLRSEQTGVFITYLWMLMRLRYLLISDVQSVNATVVSESTIDIQYWFIHGSDALGFKIVLVSDCPNISDVHVNLSRSDISASGHLSLTHNISCYRRVYAFDIDVNNSISNLTIEGSIMRDSVHVYGKIDHNNIMLCCSMHNYLHNLNLFPIISDQEKLLIRTFSYLQH